MRILLLIALSLSGAAAADPLSLVPADADVLMGIDVEHARNTRIGQLLMDRMQPDSKSFDQFATMTGFDPRRDLKQVVAASAGQPGPKTGVALLHGVFDVHRATAAATAMGQSVETVGGAALITGKDGGAVALLDSATAIAGDAEKVRPLIGRRGAATPLADAARQWSAGWDIWLVSRAPISALSGQAARSQMLQGALRGDLFKSVERTSAGVKLGSPVRILVEMLSGSAADAAGLADALRFIAAMGQNNALFQNVQVSADDRAVRVDVSLPEETVLKLLPPSTK